MSSASESQWPNEIHEFLSRWEDAAPAERSKLLADFCGQYPEHAELAREITRVQKAHEQRLAPLARASARLPPKKIDWKNWRSFLPPKIGEFELIEVVGYGGMGCVFRARQLSLKRDVAVKVSLVPDVVDAFTEELNRRNRREREVFSQLHHGSILPVFTGGEDSAQPWSLHREGPPSDSERTQRGDSLRMFWYAMTLVPGATLGAVLGHTHAIDGSASDLSDIVRKVLTKDDSTASPSMNSRKLSGVGQPIRLSVRWVRSVTLCMQRLCEAVEHIHEKGLVHCDLKPQNIMLEPNEHPWIIDFGLARIFDKLKQDSSQQDNIKQENIRQDSSQQDVGPFADTVIGQEQSRNSDSADQYSSVAGTPDYIAPEQCDEGPADSRSDIFALGEILFELLTLNPPFRGRVQEKREGSYNWSLPAMSERAIGIPDDLEAVCRKATQKAPSDRYQTAAEMAEDLKRFLEDDDVSARRPTFRQSLRRLVRRHRVWALTLALSLVLLLVVLASLIITQNSRDREKHHRLAAEDGLKRIRGFQNAYAVSLAGKSRDTGRVAHALGLLDSLQSSPGLPDVRGWEWHYLVRACREDQTKFQMQYGVARCVAASRMGNLIAWAGDDRRVYLASAQDREPRFSLEAHSAAVAALAFSPGGDQLASGDDEGVVCVWDVATGERRQLIEAHVLPITDLAWHNDARFLLTAGEDRMLRLWNAENGQPEKILSGHRDTVTDVEFSIDGSRLVTVAADRTVQVIDPSDWSAIASVKSERVSPRCAVSPDGRLLAAVAGGVGKLQLRSLPSGEVVREFEAGTSDMADLAFSPDGKTLAAAGGDGTLTLWSMPYGKRVRTYHGHSSDIRRVSYCDEGRGLITASSDGTVRLWNADFASGLHELHGHVLRPYSVSLSADGRWMASGGQDQSVRLWDLQSNSQARYFGKHTFEYAEVANAPPPIRSISTYAGHGGAIMSVAIHPDGSRIASASIDNTVRIWDATDGKELRAFQGSHVVSAVVWTHDGQRVIFGGWDDAIHVCDPETGDELLKISEHIGHVESLAVDPLGRWIASASSSPSHEEASPGKVYLWNASDGRLVRVLQGHIGDVFTVAFDRTGSLLATGGQDQEIRLWNPENGEFIRSMNGHVGPVRSLTFNHDGTRLASAGKNANDQFVRVWDTVMGVELFSTPGRNCVTFSPDGSRLVFPSASSDAIYVLDGAPDATASTKADRVPPPPGGDEPPDGRPRFRVLGYTASDRLPMIMEREPEKPFVEPKAGQKFLVVVVSVWMGELMPGGLNAVRDPGQLTGLEARQEAQRRRYVKHEPGRFRIRVGALEPRSAILISEWGAGADFYPAVTVTRSEARPVYHRQGLALVIEVPTDTELTDVRISLDEAPFVEVSTEIDSAFVSQSSLNLR